jgi:hypothetical protein
MNFLHKGGFNLKMIKMMKNINQNQQIVKFCNNLIKVLKVKIKMLPKMIYILLGRV